jgi:demethoxyubiquinone hydroxylase (CLK1/Coq7/Cat5 family)
MLSEINAKLSLLAQESVEEQIEMEYEDLMNQLNLQYQMEQMANDSSDQDAMFYGEVF